MVVVLSDDDEQLLPLKNVKRKKTENPSPRKGKAVKVEPAPAPRRTAAFLTEESFEPLNCWWEEKEKKKDGIQWSYLEHNGLMFTPAYVPHRVPVFIDGESYVLPPPAEEVANYWCAALESDYRDKSKFVGNFWAALINRLPPNHVIRENKLTLEDVDFSSIKSRLDSNREILREQRKNLTKEDRELERLKKDKEEGPYTYALVDWLREKVGTFKTEPPSLFRGRGEHPKMGMLKRRIFPEEVSLNIHEDAPVPRLPTEMIGHAWKDVYHDNTVSWLTYYRDSVNGQFKYTFLGAGSAVKGQKDHYKYEKARKLKNHIENIRKDYLTKMECDDPVDKQLGTATYMLDRLALRVGNEKDASEEADTVGCCSLRVEHLSIDKENDTITLDFLGKDSIRYLNTTKVIPIVCKNLASFIKGKKPDKEIFESISTGSLNKYLRDLMPELTAKVFRTFNASFTLQNELDKLDPTLVDLSNPETTKQFYDLANREVAILCNHQRSVPKQHESSMDKMMLQLQRYEEDIEEIKQYLAWYKGKQTHPFRFKPLQRQDGGGGGAGRVSVVKDGMKADVAQRKLILLEKRKGNHDIRMKMKDANKTVSNTTSKQHYMDPRY